MMTRKPTHLLASDFDGTIALTSVPSPNEITVEYAYETSINEIFGRNGVDAFIASGGVNSREPGEIVGCTLAQAREMGIHLNHEDNDPEELTKELVERKLEKILPEISADWPLISPEFIGFRKRLEGQPIELAVVSNGHDEFITKVFEVNGLPDLTILITSDTLRANGVPQKFKPDPYSLELAVEMFEELHGSEPRSVMYIGDSPEKDREMALRAGIPFGHFDPEGPRTVIEHSTLQIGFQDFQALGDLFFRTEGRFYGGRGFYDLFMNHRSQEGQVSAKERK